jgi:hypothetical protein
MKRWRLFVSGMLGTALVAMAGCEADDTFRQVDYDMRGIWECIADPPRSGPKGRLVLDHGSIMIIGNVKHLPDFTKDIALEAYTEDGCLYIHDRGIWQIPVSYRRWSSSDYPKKEMLTLTGAKPSDETFKRLNR